MENKQVMIAMCFILIILTSMGIIFDSLDARYLNNPQNDAYNTLGSDLNKSEVTRFIEFPRIVTNKSNQIQDNFQTAILDPQTNILDRLENIFMGGWNSATLFFDVIMSTMVFASRLFTTSSLILFGVGWIGDIIALIIGTLLAIKIANIALKRGGMG